MKRKRRKRISLLLAVTVSLFTWGCGETAKEAGNMDAAKQAEEQEPVQKPQEKDTPEQAKPTELSRDQKNLIDGFQFEMPCEANWYAVDVPGGMETAYDLDGDGKAETVYYATKVNGENGRTVNSLLISGTEFKDYVQGSNVREEYFGVVDLLEGDGCLELAVYDFGSGDDPSTAFYRYVNGTLVKLGTVQGFADSASIGSGEVHLDGKGNIYGMFRLQVLQGWHAPAQWTLTEDGMIAEVKEALYYPQMPESEQGEKRIFARESFLVYARQDTESEYTYARPSENRISFAATDNEEWLLISIEDGISGWMHLQEDSRVETEPGKYREAGEILENLVLYTE